MRALEERELRRGFNAFGDDGKPQTVPELGDGVRHGRVLDVVSHMAREGLIHLQPVNGKTREVREG